MQWNLGYEKRLSHEEVSVKRKKRHIQKICGFDEFSPVWAIKPTTLPAVPSILPLCPLLQMKSPSSLLQLILPVLWNPSYHLVSNLALLNYILVLRPQSLTTSSFPPAAFEHTQATHPNTNSNKHNISYHRKTSGLQPITGFYLLFTDILTEVVYIWCIQLIISNTFLNLLTFGFCS